MLKKLWNTTFFISSYINKKMIKKLQNTTFLISSYRNKIYWMEVNWPRDNNMNQIDPGPPNIEYKRGVGFSGEVVYSVDGKKYSDWFKWTPAFDGNDIPKEATVSKKDVNDKFKELIKSLPLAVQNDPNFKTAISGKVRGE